MGEPEVGNRATLERSIDDRGVMDSGVVELRTAIREATLPGRLLHGGPETVQELYRPPDATRPFPKVDERRYGLLPPFFETTWEAREVRMKAANDAAAQWMADTGDWADVKEATFGLITPPSKFDPKYETDPDYVDQFHVSLEHIYQHPLFLRSNVGGGVRALTRALILIFPRLFAYGRQVVGLYRIGTADTLGHHIFAKSAFPKWAWNRMLAISGEAMRALRWSHDAMTSMQKYLFRELARRGGVHTMKDHIRIAYAALRHGGATHEQARWLVAQALRNLRQLGIRHPSRLPTFGRMPKP